MVIYYLAFKTTFILFFFTLYILLGFLSIYSINIPSQDIDFCFLGYFPRACSMDLSYQDLYVREQSRGMLMSPAILQFFLSLPQWLSRSTIASGCTLLTYLATIPFLGSLTNCAILLFLKEDNKKRENIIVSW